MVTFFTSELWSKQKSATPKGVHVFYLVSEEFRKQIRVRHDVFVRHYSHAQLVSICNVGNRQRQLRRRGRPVHYSLHFLWKENVESEWKRKSWKHVGFTLIKWFWDQSLIVARPEMIQLQNWPTLSEMQGTHTGGDGRELTALDEVGNSPC